MHFEIGMSPCPNDTFIFDALINEKIDTGNFKFKAIMEDVETLNRWALFGKLPITKLSYGVLPLVLNEYSVLDSGSALGKGVGPLLISKNEFKGNVQNETIAIPGENTTAHFLFSLAYPEAKKKIFLRYDKIEEFVLEGKGLGVIIHENRFTYKEKGLHKISDLGVVWENKMHLPIPLGGIVIKKEYNENVKGNISQLIRKSLEYSFANLPQLSEFITCNAQEMSENVMRNHIDLYVNNFSVSLGDEGRNAIKKFLEISATFQNKLPEEIDFVNSLGE